MEWHEVYTLRQKQAVVNAAVRELEALVKLVKEKGFTDEVDLTGGQRFDSLVLKGGDLRERMFWASAVDPEKDGPEKTREFLGAIGYLFTTTNTYQFPYTYKFVQAVTPLDVVVEKYRLTSRGISDARAIIEKKLADKAAKYNEKTAAAEELKKLSDTLATHLDLLADEIEIARAGNARLVMDSVYGLSEYAPDTAMPALIEFGPSGDIRRKDAAAIVAKYNLTAKQLAEWREKIERV